jgi:hypothetical protein
MHAALNPEFHHVKANTDLGNISITQLIRGISEEARS